MTGCWRREPRTQTPPRGAEGRGGMGGHALAKISATAAPMKPKNGADGGHRGLISATMATSD